MIKMSLLGFSTTLLLASPSFAGSQCEDIRNNLFRTQDVSQQSQLIQEYRNCMVGEASAQGQNTLIIRKDGQTTITQRQGLIRRIDGVDVSEEEFRAHEKDNEIRRQAWLEKRKKEMELRRQARLGQERTHLQRKWNKKRYNDDFNRRNQRIVSPNNNTTREDPSAESTEECNNSITINGKKQTGLCSGSYSYHINSQGEVVQSSH